MARLEDLTRGASVKGILPDGLVTVVDVKWIGTVAIELTYKDAAGRLGNELLYRDREPTLEVATVGRPWSFDGDGGLFRLVSEAYRISLAYLFDPLLAVHTSLVEPLPHQITAVYGKMLPRQPLRYLLADDPGAGKTIMAGLLLKELLVRGDLQKCLIVCPGNLVEQWQDELDSRFHLPFEIMTNDKFESARTGNWFRENPLAICRLDKLSRNEDVQAKLQQADYDVIVCDEAHKMSATFFGSEVKYTKRYRLGQLLSGLTRHFLLLTATPHNGKEEDFQLFMALLDGDRFEGKFRDGVHVADSTDLMRRLVKEQLLKFDGTPLFPERRAYTVNYALSDGEAQLYKEVTEYVREEFNRAEALENEGRKGTVGFALTILQRRLASSPEAIYQSLRRRRERLEKRLREEQLLKRAASVKIDLNTDLPSYSADDLDDLDDAPDEEVEQAEEKVVDQASAARTIAELQVEIDMLKRLENLAYKVRHSGTDRKWDELSRLLQNNSEMFDAHGHRRKLVIFTEHRDTLNYLTDRIRSLLGRPEAVVIIHGSLGREDRRKAQEAFTQDKDVELLIATDAAGEGINLQRAHLMVNYDLPWNPNRLEQRFGRIHRIGQTEVCHLWNLVAKETREGEVYLRLLEKLEEERQALGGQVFDVLGQLTFDNRPLRELLLEAIRYGDQPEVRAKLTQVVDKALDRETLKQLIEGRALAHESMDARRVWAIREEMERAEARRLQPHFIATYFIEAFKLLGGSIREREPRRYEITHVPAVIRNRDRAIGRGEPVLQRYERVTFHKDQINVAGKPVAAFICPGHPLLDSTTDLIIERNRDLLKRGAVLVDENDHGEQLRALVYLEHSIQDARTDRSGKRRIVSRQMQFVEITQAGGRASCTPSTAGTCTPSTAGETPTPQLKGWYRRGEKHPPHFDAGEIPQFITFRLAGTLPEDRLEAWKRDLREHRLDADDFHCRIEEWLDAGHGDCWLGDERVGRMVQDAILYFDGRNYDLHGWVVMPNHVHVLITPRQGHSLPSILHSWKSYTAKQANQLLGRSGVFWQDDYFDRYMRDERHFLQTINYMAENPVRAGLCKSPEEWRLSFCSGLPGENEAGETPTPQAPMLVTRTAGYAPYLDYRPPTKQEQAVVSKLPEPPWLRSELESRVLEHAIANLVPSHFEEVRRRKEDLVDRTLAAVKDRLTKEIAYWDHRAAQLKEQELAGRVNARLNSGLARQRADDLTARLQRRLAELEQERKLSPLPPVVMGGAMIVPIGLLERLQGRTTPPTFAADTDRSEKLALAAVMTAEQRLGFMPRDVSADKCGYDIESSIPGTGRLRFIEVKGRAKGAKTVTVTKNEILTGLNKPDDFILAIGIVDDDVAQPRYIRKPFQREPDFAVTSVNYDLDELLARAEEPS